MWPNTPLFQGEGPANLPQGRFVPHYLVSGFNGFNTHTFLLEDVDASRAAVREAAQGSKCAIDHTSNFGFHRRARKIRSRAHARRGALASAPFIAAGSDIGSPCFLRIPKNGLSPKLSFDLFFSRFFLFLLLVWLPHENTPGIKSHSTARKCYVSTEYFSLKKNLRSRSRKRC